MSKPDFVVVRDQQILHETCSLAGAAAFAGEVRGSTVYERVEIGDGKEEMARFDQTMAEIEAEAAALKGGAA